MNNLAYAVIIALLVVLGVGVAENYLNNPTRGCTQTDSNTYWTQYTCNDGSHMYKPVVEPTN